MDEAAIIRRIKFLLSEAAAEPALYDQSVRMTMRVISNWVSCGKDVSSSEAKKLARFMSREALALKRLLNDHKEFAARTINEHPDELRNVWRWMVEYRGNLAVDQVLDRFKEWPMVVITRDEDAAMRTLKNLGPKERYMNIDILRETDGEWVSVIASSRVESQADKN